MLLKCILLLLSNVFIFVLFKDKLGKGFPLLNLAHSSLTGPVIKMNQVRSQISSYRILLLLQACEFVHFPVVGRSKCC